MLRRERAKTIDINLHIKGAGDDCKFDVTYHNRTQEELEAFGDGEEQSKTGPEFLAYIVKEWDSEYPPTKEGFIDAEKDRPGIGLALMQGFGEARLVHKVKN